MITFDSIGVPFLNSVYLLHTAFILKMHIFYREPNNLISSPVLEIVNTYVSGRWKVVYNAPLEYTNQVSIDGCLR